jgi:hypothetical protein
LTILSSQIDLQQFTGNLVLVLTHQKSACVVVVEVKAHTSFASHALFLGVSQGRCCVRPKRPVSAYFFHTDRPCTHTQKKQQSNEKSWRRGRFKRAEMGGEQEGALQHTARIPGFELPFNPGKKERKTNATAHHSCFALPSYSFIKRVVEEEGGSSHRRKRAHRRSKRAVCLPLF